MQRVCFYIVVWGLLAVGSNSVFAADPPTKSACSAGQDQPSIDSGPYTASCGSKTDCAVTDTLSIVGARPENGPAGVCLRIGNAMLDLKQPPLPKAGDQPAIPPAPSASAAFAMNSVLSNALHGKDAAGFAEALKQPNDSRRDIKVIMTDEMVNLRRKRCAWTPPGCGLLVC